MDFESPDEIDNRYKRRNDKGDSAGKLIIYFLFPLSSVFHPWLVTNNECLSVLSSGINSLKSYE